MTAVDRENAQNTDGVKQSGPAGKRRGGRGERGEKRKPLPLTHSLLVKIVVLVLLTVIVFVAISCAIVMVAAYQADLYSMNADILRERDFKELCYSKTDDLWEYYLDGEERLLAALEYTNIAYVSISPIEGEDYGTLSVEPLECSTGEEYREPYELTHTVYYIIADENGEYAETEYSVAMKIGVSEELVELDEFLLHELAIEAIYLLRDWLIPIIIVLPLLGALCFAYLLLSAGKRRKKEGVSPSIFTRIPFDLLTAAVVLTEFFGIYLMLEMMGYTKTLREVVLAIPVAVILFVVAVLWCMSLALRIKLGTVFTSTLIYKLFRLFYKLIRAIPLVPKTVILLLAIFVIELFFLTVTRYEYEIMFIGFLMGKFILFGFIIYVAICLRKLKDAAARIAKGELSHKVNTSGMFLDIKEHGETLNGIGDGLVASVEQRIRSERMKTELITNVTHDIKTPLTSIINYSDLICREESGSEKIREYAEVLHRQSIRMKRLIDDLIEAARASSGNVELDMRQCDAGVFLSQALAEFEDRLRACSLELHVSREEGEIGILADSRSLYRVFDNLLGNITKYSQSQTRVYISLERRGERAVYTFKNISKDPLNISPDELTERFVRGDASRNSEGNGLGLSISKSLVELQGGELEIGVDGDLFKVEVSFPLSK